ncbi:glycosyltransferase family 2 protein [Pseudomonas sp. dw_358]|uniref:glycosyltransferase family 2 protein n=1 Tax=Pseudomonas sp. dw_358 TaxID=2720083 RepID=UPI001BD5BAAA|nr:glycosyltransferase family 2 protein [Pseudomonas sp. dw_358]
MTMPIKDSSTTPCVAVLLCTFNGGRYLAEQLDSISAQTCGDWVVYASDDGSTDGTLAILSNYQAAWGHDRLKIFKGPRQGFSKNFLSVLGRASGHHRFYAFCDQDDRWHAEKLERAADWLTLQPDEVPALYCGRTRVVDEAGKESGFSPLFNKPPTFKNALTQNIAGGNTMVINAGGCRVLALTPSDMPLVCHDWWAYLLITGCGGKVHYDKVPTLDYRQHAENIIGAGITLRSRVFRLQRLLGGTFSEWNERNISGLRRVQDHLTPMNLNVLERFDRARQASLLPRVFLIASSRLYRQTVFGNLGLALAVLIKRI